MSILPKRIVTSPLGHSADVVLNLHVGSSVVPLAQVMRNAVKLTADTAIARGLARIEVIVDGVAQSTQVTILGAQAKARWLDIA